jgi:hypothetical protein
MATDGAAQSWIRPALRALAGRRGRNELAYQKPMARFPRRVLGFPAADRDDPENCWLKSRITHNWPTAVAVDQGTSRAARPGAGSSLDSTNGKPRVGNSKLITQNSRLKTGAWSSLLAQKQPVLLRKVHRHRVNDPPARLDGGQLGVGAHPSFRVAEPEISRSENPSSWGHMRIELC